MEYQCSSISEMLHQILKSGLRVKQLGIELNGRIPMNPGLEHVFQIPMLYLYHLWIFLYTLTWEYWVNLNHICNFLCFLGSVYPLLPEILGTYWLIKDNNHLNPHRSSFVILGREKQFMV